MFHWPWLQCYNCATIVWLQRVHTLCGHQRMCLAYCSGNILYTTTEEVEYTKGCSQGLYHTAISCIFSNTGATLPTLLTQHDRKQTLTLDIKLFETRVSRMQCFFFVCQKWVIEATHCFSLLPHSSVFNFTALLIKLSHIFLSLLLSPIKKSATGGYVKTTLFNIMEILYQWAAFFESVGKHARSSPSQHTALSLKQNTMDKQK